MIYAFSVEMVSGEYQSVQTGFSTAIYPGPIILEASALPDGVILVVQSNKLVLIGVPKLDEVGAWPISVAFLDATGTAIVTLPPIVGMMEVLSSEDIAAEGMPAALIELGDYYYALSGGPLRQEMRYAF